MSTLNNRFKLSHLACCVVLSSLSSIAVANEVEANTAVDEHIEIKTNKHRLAFPTREEMKAELKNVAGGTNLIELDKLPARQATLQDALGFEAGVIMQSFFGGNDQPRLNIRGSGVQSNPVNRGIQLLYDGLPINAADGSFIIGFLDPKAAEMISVHRGANGLRYGATTLGGAINLISRNGTSSPTNLRVEYGNDNRIGAGVQIAGQEEELDYFASLSTDSYDGYRNHSESKRTNFAGNLGYSFAKNIYNRTYLNISDNYFDIPFVVTKAQALANPKQVLGDGNTPLDKLLNVYKRNPFRDSQQVRLANKTRISDENALHEIGVYYQGVDDTFTDPLNHNVSESKDYGLEYAYTVNTDILSENDNILISASMNQSDIDRNYFANNPENGERLQKFGSQTLQANNAIIALQWQAELSEQFQMIAAGQWVHSNRDVSDNTAMNLNQDKSYSSFNPKLGFNFLPSDTLRFFANVSKTAEAPTFWELVSTKVSPKKPQMAAISLNDLAKQSSSTFEIGTTGELDNVQWNLSLYRTKVEDELISVVSDFAVNGTTKNYQDSTIHQGIELELKAQFSDNFLNTGTKVASKVVYNYNDFYFDGGQYQDNQIAGISKHLLQAELSFTTDSGIYIAPNILWQPEETAVDHANSQFQDSYLLVGLKLSYQVDNDLRFYLDAQNLTDEEYQTTYVIRGFSNEKQPTFLPGFGPSFSAGMQMNF